MSGEGVLVLGGWSFYCLYRNIFAGLCPVKTKHALRLIFTEGEMKVKALAPRATGDGRMSHAGCNLSLHGRSPRCPRADLAALSRNNRA
jgi:hypothetical protein